MEAWVTVRSSSTPSAPITIPASNSPWTETSSVLALRIDASSEEKPVMWARSVTSSASTSVIARAAAVPRQAAMALGPRPWVSGIVTSITARAPTVATATGSPPSRIAGTMKRTTMARLAPSPMSARRPASAR